MYNAVCTISERRSRWCLYVCSEIITIIRPKSKMYCVRTFFGRIFRKYHCRISYIMQRLSLKHGSRQSILSHSSQTKLFDNAYYVSFPPFRTTKYIINLIFFIINTIHNSIQNLHIIYWLQLIRLLINQNHVLIRYIYYIYIV